MADPTELDELLFPLIGAGDSDDALDVVDAVGANLATHFDRLVEAARSRLVKDPSWKVRAALAYALGLVAETKARKETLEALLLDAHATVSKTALEAHTGPVSERATDALRARIASRGFHGGHVRALAGAADRKDEAAFRAMLKSPSPELESEAIGALGRLEALDVDSLEVLLRLGRRSQVRAQVAEVVSQLSVSMGMPALQGLLAERPPLRELLGHLAERLHHPYQALFKTLASSSGLAFTPSTPSTRTEVPKELQGFGVVLTGSQREHAARHEPPSGPSIDEVCRMLTEPARKSVVLVGPPGVGKTSFVHAVARKLASAQPAFVVLETASAEVMAGTKFLGEWETRLRRLIELAKRPARVILYFTDVAALGSQGRSLDRDGSFADLLAPYLDRGELAILGEATDVALERGLLRHEAMRRLFTRVRLIPLTAAQAAPVVRARLAHAGELDRTSYVASAPVIEQLVETASLYAPGVALPGSAARLTDAVVEQLREAHEKDVERPVEVSLESGEVIATLARATGMPVNLLDDRAPFDLAAVRAFFEERVIGQPEAIDVVVELVTLIKAGLDDPDRPYGTLFFVGPTGVGKTELAKALAEHLFGTAERLVRIDMSELKEWDSYERLIGSLRNPAVEGVLTRKIAEQPFSVVLLDEIEKAHANVHDVLLQLLDEGRLTDPRGRTTDFRRTVVVMTSNVGSKIETDALGFDAKTGQAPSEDKVLREVRKVFRPELVNRLGRIIVFRPLGPDTMRTLVRRELGSVVLRSGVLRRRLVIDVAPDVVDFLAKDGFSITYGARPLKRRVERRVLLPIAERIVLLGADAAGTVLKVEVGGDRVVVRTIAPPSEPAPRARQEAPRRDPSLKAAASRHESVRARLLALMAHPLRREAEKRRTELLEATSRPSFWDDPELARGRMSELAELDERHATLEGLELRVDGVGEMVRELERKRQKLAARAHDALDAIEQALRELEIRLLASRPEDRADVILTVTRLGNGPADQGLMDFLTELYAAWARRHQTQVHRLDVQSDALGLRSLTLHLEGHGLYGRLRGEAGLHRLAETGRGKERRNVAARVTVLACPEEARSETQIQKRVSRGRAHLVVTHPQITRTLETELAATELDDETFRLLGCWLRAVAESPDRSPDAPVRRYGVEDRYTVEESSGQRSRMKDLAESGLDAIFAARIEDALKRERA